ncbi:MAG TPA: beta-N-acetylhexosaminidase, partial [Saprospiraceae bacterium]|nr:beta-N-acetylhexosaminidase [Saprospiraceae bacterium]
MSRFSIYILFSLFSISMYSQAIIPKPVSMSVNNGDLVVDSRLSMLIDAADSDQLRASKELLNIFSNLGIQLKRYEGHSGAAVKFSKANDTNGVLGKEGYKLIVNAAGIDIQATSFGGYFNGLQTLRQLLPVKAQSKLVTIPYTEIEDYPRFGWRGLMLDVSRHFFSVEDVKKYIDQMVLYKFNVLHWHLTDDEGWRIEIKSLPKLTSVGAWRVERHGKFGEGRALPKPGEKAIYGGFYTHEQIKDVVAYAQERNVTIVPEIDMPGHSMCILAAYPELSVGKTPKFVNPGSKFSEWYADGTFKMLIENTLDPTNEIVYDMIDKVMTEVASLFPAQYIHMGGDE